MPATAQTLTRRRLANRYDDLKCRNHNCLVQTFTRGRTGHCPSCQQRGQERWETLDLS